MFTPRISGPCPKGSAESAGSPLWRESSGYLQVAGSESKWDADTDKNCRFCWSPKENCCTPDWMDAYRPAVHESAQSAFSMGSRHGLAVQGAPKLGRMPRNRCAGQSSWHLGWTGSDDLQYPKMVGEWKIYQWMMVPMGTPIKRKPPWTPTHPHLGENFVFLKMVDLSGEWWQSGRPQHSGCLDVFTSRIITPRRFNPPIVMPLRPKNCFVSAGIGMDFEKSFDHVGSTYWWTAITTATVHSKCQWIQTN